MSLTDRLDAAIRVVPDFPKPGISFKDITPIMLDNSLVSDLVQALADPFREAGVTKVVGIESRGFLLGPMIAQELGAGFVMVRKKGKLPAKTTAVTYDLEYGSATIEVHHDAIKSEDKLLIHDDLLATGGTAAAAASLAQEYGAHLSGFAFIVTLDFLPGRQKLAQFDVPLVSTLACED